MNETSDSIDTLKRALALAEQAGSNNEQRQLLSDLGKALFQSGDYQQAREYHENALVIDKTLHDSYGVACDLWQN